MVGFVVSHLGSIAILFAVTVFGLSAYQRRADGLYRHLIRAAGASALPYGLVLLFYAIVDPEAVGQIPGLQVPLAIGALALLYISVSAVVE